MKKSLLVLLLSLSSVALAADKVSFAGSDTLAGAMTDAIIAAGLDNAIQYSGGGSGLGEKGLIGGDQGIAPMSREITADALKQLKAQKNDVITHVLALDGLSIFVSKDNKVPYLDLGTIAAIFRCEITKWEKVPNSGMKGEIAVFRRNDNSGTTDAFKHFTGVKKFGDCAKALNETPDISDATSRDVLAIGFSGLSGKVDGNRSVALNKKAGDKAILPTTTTVRDFTYPMARRLYVYEITGASEPNDAEKALLQYVTDRSFMDPIMQAHEFITID